MGEQQNWRELIQSYLQACCDHERLRRRERAASDWESSFLAAHGTPAMQQCHADSIQRCAASVPVSVGPESINVVEKTRERLIVDIICDGGPRQAEQIPHFTTRIVLQKSASGWLIDKMLTPCVACNLGYERGHSPISYTPGKCYLCRGSGTARNRHKQGIWPFRTVTMQPCVACEGKGICNHCAETETPGWRTTASIG